MTTNALTHRTVEQTGRALNPRLLGTLGLAGSSMLFLEGLWAGFASHGTDQVVGALEVIYIAGWMSSVLGLHALNVTGTGRLGKAVLFIQLFSLSLAGIWSAYHLITPIPNTDHALYLAGDMAWPLSHLFMIVVGIAVLRAKTWTGRRRFIPLMAGLALPAAILTGVAAGREEAMGITFGLLTMLAFALLGYAVRTSNKS